MIFPSTPSSHRPSSSAIAPPVCLPLASELQLVGGSLRVASDDALYGEQRSFEVT